MMKKIIVTLATLLLLCGCGFAAERIPMVAIDGGPFVEPLPAIDTIPGGSITIAIDSIGDVHIDWGLGAGQVSAVDIPTADAGGLFAVDNVEASLQEVMTDVVAAEADIDALENITQTMTGDATGITFTETINYLNGIRYLTIETTFDAVMTDATTPTFVHVGSTVTDVVYFFDDDPSIDCAADGLTGDACYSDGNTTGDLNDNHLMVAAYGRVNESAGGGAYDNFTKTKGKVFVVGDLPAIGSIVAGPNGTTYYWVAVTHGGAAHANEVTIASSYFHESKWLWRAQAADDTMLIPLLAINVDGTSLTYSGVLNPITIRVSTNGSFANSPQNETNFVSSTEGELSLFTIASHAHLAFAVTDVAHIVNDGTLVGQWFCVEGVAGYTFDTIAPSF